MQREIIDGQQLLASAEAAHKSRMEVSMYHQDGERHRATQVREWERSGKQEIQSTKIEKKRQRQALLEMLSPYDYKPSFSKAYNERHTGTGQWIFDCQEFLNWKQADGSCGIWISGIPGSGKTVLASSIVDHMFALQQGSSSMNSISYFFCDFNNQQSRGTRTILGSLARQILHIFDETPEIDEKLKSMFVTNHREPTIEDLFALLECIARIPATAFLLIDGLDECGDSDRRQVLSFIKQVFRDSQCKIKIIVSSRWDLDISNALVDFQQISLGSGTCSDIELFVRDIVDRRLADGSIETQNPAMAQEIRTALIEKSGGMFLWVTFQIPDICRENNDDDIREVLRSLPKGLTETYTRILERVSKSRKPDVAKRVFHWLTVARRPLLLDELAESTALEPGRVWDERYRPTSNERVLQNCGNLVLLRREDNTVQFAHSTVKEYFLSLPEVSPFSLSTRGSDLYVGKLCLAYLNISEFETQLSCRPAEPIPSAVDIPVTEWVPSMVGIRPAGVVWEAAKHVLFRGPTSTVTPARFLPRGPLSVPTVSQILAKKYKLIEYVSSEWIYHCTGLQQSDQTDWETFENLVFHRILSFPHLPWEPLNQTDIEYQHIFQWAVKNEHIPLLILVTSRLEKLDTPIQPYILMSLNDNETLLLNVVSDSKDKTMSQMMLEMWVHAHKRSGPAWHGTARHGTAWNAALEMGPVAIVKLFVSHGYDINATMYHRTILQEAAEGGNLAVVEYLISAGVKVNAAAAEYNGRTAMQAAAEGGNLAIVEYLISAGANVNAVAAPHNGRTAMQAAAEGGHLAVVERLISVGSDVNAAPSPDRGRTALQAAAERGHLAVVERLISVGSDVNAAPSPWDGQTALQAAARGGHLDVIERLILAGADVNARPVNGGRTALQGVRENAFWYRSNIPEATRAKMVAMLQAAGATE
ncbi:hypothetical protein Q9L58_008114 [Maublancomyces gigas]|uniref:NACHT domain-containing protein n=1 Tax=Discina gigas TaxID=1032678 RepID=A0ABR3GB15_9PEZI